MTRLWRSKGSSRILRHQALSLVVSLLPAPLLMAAPAASTTDIFQTSGDDPTASALFDKAKSAVVQVRSGDKGYILAGSGFFIDDHGTLLTSSTVLGENTSARIIVNGIELDAKIVGNDPRSGLAMLRASYDESPWLPMGHANSLKSGDNVTLIGFPMSLPVAPSQGLVSGFDGSYLAKIEKAPAGKNLSAIERFATTHVHANLPISPGEVGGPLLNSRGEVVGLVATSPDNGQSVYALPVEAILKIVADFNIYGQAHHGWVGINVIEAPDTNHDGRTVRVVQIAPGTPASKSGIQVGDIVMRIDSREIYRPADVQDASFFSRVGGTMAVVVRRDDKLLNYSFTVIERPANPAASTPAVTASPRPSAELAKRDSGK